MRPGVLLYALTEQYSSPGRLADYRRQFERISWRPGEDPSVFAVELETLELRVFGDFSSSARLQLVRDRFIVGQVGCSLRRHLDGVEPGTPIRDIVDRCRVWESHAEDTDCRGTAPILNRPLPIYPIEEVRTESGPVCSSDNQDLLESLMRHLLPILVLSPPKVSRVPSEHEQFIQRLMGREPPLRPLLLDRTDLTDMEIIMQSLTRISNNDGPQDPCCW